MKEADALGEDLIRTRRIWTELGSRTLHIENIIENLGYQDSSYMYLFHIACGCAQGSLVCVGCRVVFQGCQRLLVFAMRRCIPDGINYNLSSKRMG